MILALIWDYSIFVSILSHGIIFVFICQKTGFMYPLLVQKSTQAHNFDLICNFFFLVNTRFILVFNLFYVDFFWLDCGYLYNCGFNNKSILLTIHCVPDCPIKSTTRYFILANSLFWYSNLIFILKVVSRAFCLRSKWRSW